MDYPIENNLKRKSWEYVININQIDGAYWKRNQWGNYSQRNDKYIK